MSPDASAVSGASLRERFGWRAERRPEPGFGHVLGAAAGSFFVFAAVALAIEIAGGEDATDVTLEGILFSVALLVIGIVGGATLSGPVRTACVTLVVLANPLLWAFVFFGDSEGGRSAARGFWLLSIAGYAVFALLVWTRGRGLLIGLLLFFVAAWILFEVGGDQGGLVPFQDLPSQTSSSPFDIGGNDNAVLESQSDTSTETSAVSLVIGLIYLGAAWRLDRQRLAGLATPFIFVGALFGVLGAIALGAEESVIAGGLSAAGIGAVVGIIGGLGEHRRATTWIGVILVKIGLGVVAADVTTDALGLAGLFALFALGLGVIAIYAARQLHEYPDGDEEAPPMGPSTTPSTSTAAT
jgi:hypothetical protein